MASPLAGVRVPALFAAALALPVLGFVARADDQAPEGGGRKPFAGTHTPEERHALLDAWKASRGQQQPSRSALARTALGIGVTPIVGRASMVINASNTVVYTKNFLGLANNCDADIGYAGDWHATTAYAAGDYVRHAFTCCGSNFMATNAGTSGAVEPAWNNAFGVTTTDGSITWVSTGTTWAATRAYTVGMTVETVASSYVGFTYKATTAGTSASTEPFWPTTAGGTVSDGGVVWKAIGYFPGAFKGCNPMQLVSRASGGAETVIASEGDAVGGSGSVLSGWGEFIATNSSGKTAFRAAVAGLLSDEDESGSGIFLAGPGAGSLTKIATSGDTIGSRFTCGFSTMVGMNDAGQVIFDGYTFAPGNAWLANHVYALNATVTPTPPNGLRYVATVAGTSGGSQPAFPTSLNATVADGTVTWKAAQPRSSTQRCDEDSQSLIRFTSGPGNELLVTLGSSVGGSTVVGFGNDVDNAAFNSRCSGCEYQNIDGLINSSGHVPVVLRLADGTRGVYNFSAPGVSTEVARTGGTYSAISPRVSINNSDQVVFKAVSGVDKIFRFTPPSTTVAVAAVGDDIGTRTTGVASGVTISALGTFTDLNNPGNVVFEADLSGGNSGFYFWDATTGRLSQIVTKATGTRSPLAPDMITLNDSNVVAYVTGSDPGSGDVTDEYESFETGGLFFWKSGVSTKAIAVGDTVAGDVVTTVYAQHRSFVRRQLSSTGCVATTYHVLGDDPGFDCDEGQTTGCSDSMTKGGLLFISCTTSCPAILVSPPTLPGGAQGVAYNQTITATGGAGPYTFTLTSGALPTGMNPLSSGGALSGTPTAANTFNFTVTATDANLCTSSQAYTIVVGAPAQVNLSISPDSLSTTTPGGTIAYTVTISVAQGTDTIITLTSGNPGVATVPATVTILAGQTTATFNATGVSAGGPVEITAALPGSFNAPPATAYASVNGVAAAAPIPTLGMMALAVLAVALAIAGALLTRK